MSWKQLGGATLAFFALAAQASPDPYPSTYQRAVERPGADPQCDGPRRDWPPARRRGRADSRRQDRRGRHGAAQGDATTIDAQGRWVTPGLIDVHSHLGVYASPGINATQDGNEMTDPVTAGVWAEHSVWPQDPGFATALAGGVTTMQILPGSANLIGGRGVTLRNVPATTYQAMKFPGAPQGLKMACGENPKRVYGERKQAPSTRMGNVAGYRQAFADAEDYQHQWQKYEAEVAAYDKKKAKDRDPAERPCRRSAICGSRPSSQRCRGRCRCTCTATAPTRWP